MSGRSHESPRDRRRRVHRIDVRAAGAAPPTPRSGRKCRRPDVRRKPREPARPRGRRAARVRAREDIRDGDAMLKLMRQHAVDAVVNFAAEGRVEPQPSWSGRSHSWTPTSGGTLRAARGRARAAGILQRFVQNVRRTKFTEHWRRPGASSMRRALWSAREYPYAASKAAADEVRLTAFHRITYGMDTVIARCANNYGPRQFTEKLVPVMILNTLDGRELPVSRRRPPDTRLDTRR